VNKQRRTEGRALSGFARLFAPEALETRGFKQGRRSWIDVKPRRGPRMRITHEVLEGLSGSPFEHSRRAMELLQSIKEPRSCEDAARNFGRAEQAFAEAAWTNDTVMQQVAAKAVRRYWLQLEKPCLIQHTRAFDGLSASSPPPIPLHAKCIAWKYVDGKRRCAIRGHETGYRKPIFGSALR
jgi:hypothetical protein